MNIRTVASAHIHYKEFVIAGSVTGRLCADDFADE